MSDSNHEQREVDEITGTQTTGHEWDGIKELDTPMPRWWVWTFYATIAFSIGYVIYYPAIPLLTTSTVGISGITARSLVEEELATARAAQAKLADRLVKANLEDVRKDQQLYRFAVAGGQSLYKVYCSQCHGSGAQGAAGIPNLNDDDWLWGGDLKSLRTTIAHGVRDTADENARASEMPAFGRDEILSADEISAVTEYVLRLASQDHDQGKADAGKALYADNCASCHGDNGRGIREFGAPNLADALALYGATREELKQQIKLPKHGVMPAWLKRLGEARVRQLAIYVHGLGGGEKPKQE